MKISLADKADEYMGFANHCLELSRSLPRREDRIALREMSADWINLAVMLVVDATRASSQPGSMRIRAVS